MFERLTADKVYLNSIRFGIQVNFPPHCGHEKTKEVDDFVKNVFDRLAAYEDSGLSPEEVQSLAQAKVEGRLVVLKASISQDVWFYDGANRLMEGKVLEYFNCGNGLIYQVQGTKKGLWLHECEIFLTREAAEKALAESAFNALDKADMVEEVEE